MRRAKGMSALVGVRMLPNQLAALDRWIATQKGAKPTRPEAIRILIDRSLRRKDESRAVVIHRVMRVGKNNAGQTKPEPQASTQRQDA